MPRLTIATDEERTQLLAAAQPPLHFFLLLCSDLGLRHSTAARIALSNYDQDTRSLTFTTKGDTHQTLPVTDAIRAVIETLPRKADRTEPIVNLLRPPSHPGHKPGRSPRFLKQWAKLKDKLSIRRELRIHDLRRTVAEEIWNATKDIRVVQAQLGHRSPNTTVKYLANRIALQDLQPVLEKVMQLRAQREQREQQRTP
jgi:integrase